MKRKTPPKRADGQSQISITLPQSLLDEIDHYAQQDKRSRSNWIVVNIESVIAARGELEPAPPAHHPLDGVITSVPGLYPPTHAIFANEPPPAEPHSDAAGAKSTRARRALRKMASKENPKKK